jgi:hypothetical protein
MLRVNRPRCGVKVETAPWATGKSSLTKAYAYLLAAWTKRMNWSDVAKVFHTSWESVFRRREVKDLEAKGLGEVLERARWTPLKRPEDRTASQETKLAKLVRHNLRAVRAHLLREEFQQFWEYLSPFWAGSFEGRTGCRGDAVQAVRSQCRIHQSQVATDFGVSPNRVEEFVLARRRLPALRDTLGASSQQSSDGRHRGRGTPGSRRPPLRPGSDQRRGPTDSLPPNYGRRRGLDAGPPEQINPASFRRQPGAPRWWNW